MRLAALAFGHGIDIERIGGAVVAVFPHACEILTSGGRLITLASKSAGTLPGGITVDTPDDFEFARAVAPDAEAVTRAGVLRFSNSELTIDLRAAEPWHSGVRALALDLAQTPQRYLWEQAQEALRADGRIAPFLGIAAVAIGDLIDASHVFDDTKAQAAAARLIGLGDGTTPAGDDFLVGHLGGLWSSARGQPSRLDFAKRTRRRHRCPGATHASRQPRLSRRRGGGGTVRAVERCCRGDRRGIDGGRGGKNRRGDPGGSYLRRVRRAWIVDGCGGVRRSGAGARAQRALTFF